MIFISIHLHPINQQLCITRTTALVPTPKPTLRSQSELPGGGGDPEVMMVGIPKMFGWAGLVDVAGLVNGKYSGPISS